MMTINTTFKFLYLFWKNLVILIQDCKYNENSYVETINRLVQRDGAINVQI